MIIFEICVAYCILTVGSVPWGRVRLGAPIVFGLGLALLMWSMIYSFFNGWRWFGYKSPPEQVVFEFLQIPCWIWDLCLIFILVNSDLTLNSPANVPQLHCPLKITQNNLKDVVVLGEIIKSVKELWSGIFFSFRLLVISSPLFKQIWWNEIFFLW